jgi:hypothetical protein
MSCRTNSSSSTPRRTIRCRRWRRTADLAQQSGVRRERPGRGWSPVRPPRFRSSPGGCTRRATTRWRSGSGSSVAALCRGLVETAAEEWAAGKPPPPVPTAMLRLASWQAARWGNSSRLLDPLTSRPRWASDVIAELVVRVSPALRRCGDEDLVTERIDRVFVRGNGATRQREVFAGRCTRSHAAPPTGHRSTEPLRHRDR